jgi:pyrroline-5-carboxylate reductase
MSALEKARVTFIGSGAMGGAMIEALLKQPALPPEAITASDVSRERLQELAARYGIRTTADNTEAVRDAQVVVLAVKPQMLPQALPPLRGRIPAGAFVLSIVAGVRAGKIAQELGHPAIVRVMPNTPAQIGQGMSVWYSTPEVTAEQREQARAILCTMGEELAMAQEDHIDMATALSGSGPAYVLLFIEAMVDAGVHLGLARPVAQQLTLQTLQGTVALARQSGVHPAELRNRVTSPGGTTAEALYQLEKGGLRTTLSRAIWACYQKVRYLGGLTKE